MDVEQNVGWVKMSRSVVDWEWYKDPIVSRVFFHIVWTANWKDGRYKGRAVPRGSLVTSIQHLADDLGLSKQNVRTALKKLKSTHEITCTTTNRFTVINVENYEFYQCDGPRINTLVNSVANNQVTNNQQTTNKQLTTIEEYKNIRNKKYLNNGQGEDEVFGESLPLERMESIVRKITAMQGADDG